MKKESFVIVSRHAAAVEFVRLWLGTQPEWCQRLFEAGETLEAIPVLASATADDVRGKVVFGNLPLFLAAQAAEIVSVEFRGTAPRGQEYDLAAMQAAGAQLVSYVVRTPADLRAVADAVESETSWFRPAIEAGRVQGEGPCR